MYLVHDLKEKKKQNKKKLESSNRGSIKTLK